MQHIWVTKGLIYAIFRMRGQKTKGLYLSLSSESKVKSDLGMWDLFGLRFVLYLKYLRLLMVTEDAIEKSGSSEKRNYVN